MLRLQEAARSEGLSCEIIDEFGVLDDPQEPGSFKAHSVYNPSFFYRMNPLGYVRIGGDGGAIWENQNARKWDPEHDDPVDTVGYWPAVLAYARTVSTNTERGGSPGNVQAV